MSLTLNMVGGGGGGLKNTDAVLIVTVPTDSTVTATKGGTTLTPTMWVKAADASLDCAIFNISASLFDATNPWTVTATQGANTASTTIFITTNKEYDVVLSYWNGEIYKNGNQYLDQTGGFTEVKAQQSFTFSGTVTYGEEPNGVITITEPANYTIAVCTVNKIDLTDFDYVNVKIETNTFSSDNRLYIIVNDTNNNISVASASQQTAQMSIRASQIGLFQLDISGLSGEYYLVVGGYGAANYACTISEWYLS